MGKNNKDLYIGIAAIAVWAAGCFALLAWLYADYMYKVEELSLFVATTTYLHQCMSLPGGLITWCSTLLTCTLANQYAGAAAIMAVLLLLTAASIRGFELPRRWWAASVVIPTLPLLSFLRLGYDIFVIKPLGFAFSLPLGMLICVLGYWGYRKIADWRLRSILVILIVAIGYHYLGFYALLAALMCGCSGVIQTGKKKKWTVIVPLLFAIALIAAVPQLYFRYIPSNLMPSQIYLSPLPRFFAAEYSQWGFYAGIFALLVALSLFSGRWPKIAKGLSLSVWAAAVACLLVLRCDDKNLMHTLAIARAINAQQWDKAAKMANDIDFEPTRLNTVLGYVAHLRNGSLGTQLFESKYGWAPYNTSRGGDPMHDAGAALISYNLGLINYAYRWATEYMVEQGMGAERMKMMVRCALLNYETDLAKHYLNILYNVPNQRQWAKKYLRYASNPLEMGRDPELVAVKALMCQPNIFINDGGAVESYIWPLLAASPTGTAPFMELSIYAALINRDIDTAAARIADYAANIGTSTKTMQEAALFWSKTHNAACPISVDPAVENSYSRFENAFRSFSRLTPEEQREMLRPNFANTLWFYMVFTEDNEIK